jgi:hypothetical protein
VIEELAEWIDGAFERYGTRTPHPSLVHRRDSHGTRRRDSPARKPIPQDSFSTSETETDDSGITFVPRRRTSPPESVNGGGPRTTPTNRSPTETSGEDVEGGHNRVVSETDTKPRPGGQTITETELMRRRRLLDAHIFE